MRHLRRHYFDNCLSDLANDQYVAVIDHGRDNSGVERYNVVVGTMLTLPEILTAAQLLVVSPCFFKLPIGASAILDIYIPDSSQSDEPKTFDYQVFKAKLPATVSEPRAKQPGEAFESLSQLLSDAQEKAGSLAKPEGSPAGAAGPLGATGVTGATCYWVFSGPTGASGPCGGQTEIPCDDPIFSIADCVCGVLQCVPPSATGKPPRESAE